MKRKLRNSNINNLLEQFARKDMSIFKTMQEYVQEAMGKLVDIGGIEAEICDNAQKKKKGFKISKNINPWSYKDKKQQMIGGGPSGLEMRRILKAREGVKVTIYEKHSELGGIPSTWHSRIQIKWNNHNTKL